MMKCSHYTVLSRARRQPLHGGTRKQVEQVGKNPKTDHRPRVKVREVTPTHPNRTAQMTPTITTHPPPLNGPPNRVQARSLNPEAVQVQKTKRRKANVDPDEEARRDQARGIETGAKRGSPTGTRDVPLPVLRPALHLNQVSDPILLQAETNQ